MFSKTSDISTPVAAMAGPKIEIRPFSGGVNIKAGLDPSRL